MDSPAAGVLEALVGARLPRYLNVVLSIRRHVRDGAVNLADRSHLFQAGFVCRPIRFTCRLQLAPIQQCLRACQEFELLG